VEATFDYDEAKRSVLAVSQQGGRGFVADIAGERRVITAGHCLPRLPIPDPGAQEERTYWKLLGPLGGQLTITAECLFVDPVSDLAVLGPPDNQVLANEFKAYGEFVLSAAALSMGHVQGEFGDQSCGWLLSLAGVWFRCKVSHYGGGLWVTEASHGIIGGMSGSPILNDDGAVIGVVSCSGGLDGELHTEGGPNPRLTHHLPAWLLSTTSP
jgi:hypothetical protein